MSELKIIKETREKIISSFKDLEFIEGPHQYFRTMENGEKIEYTPVSYVIEKWISQFDTDTNAEKYATKNGLNKEDVLKQWKYTNLLSTVTGSLVHEYGESYGWLKGGHPENITQQCRPQYISDENWLIPTRPKEKAIKKFFEELNPSLHFVGAEFKMHSGYMNIGTKMSGTFDLLLYFKNPTKGGKSGFVLCDWKTNKSLYSEYNESHSKMMLPPFSDLYDEPLGHYTLQFGCYQLMLQSIGIPIIGRRLIWLKDDETYEVIKIADKTKELLNVL
jgi:hypothetical protein